MKTRTRLVGERWVTSREKRRIDLLLATGSMPLVLPAWIGLAAAIATIDKTNPMFIQERGADNNGTFDIMKLRTMPDETEHTDSQFFYDPRRSKLGSKLSRIRLDELPQVVNVLRDEMSWVGPRPIVEDARDKILCQLSRAEQIEWLWARRVCKPGIIDPFNVEALWGHEHPDQLYRVESDIEYARNASFWGDVGTITDCGAAIISLAARRTEHAIVDHAQKAA